MFAYEKTVLYVYPRTEYLKKMYRTIADGRICRSFRIPDTERLTKEVIDDLFLVEALEKWRKRSEEILSRFSEEELCLLEYKFFRRKKFLYGKFRDYEFPFSYTSFFRRIRSVTSRFAKTLHGYGFTEKDFLKDFEKSELVMRVYKNVCLGKDECYLRGKESTFRFRGRNHSS